MFRWLRVLDAFRGPTFDTQHPHSGSQPLKTSGPGNPMLSSGPQGHQTCMWCTEIHVGKNTLSLKGKINKNKILKEQLQEEWPTYLFFMSFFFPFHVFIFISNFYLTNFKLHRLSLCSSSCPGTCYAHQPGLASTEDHMCLPTQCQY